MPTQFSKIEELLVNFAATQPNIVAIYIFGSYAEGTTTKASDVDIGILLKSNLPYKEYLDQQLYLGGKLCEVLSRNDVDVVILNQCNSAELKYAIIQDGILIFDRHPDITSYEINMKREYFDFKASLKRAGFEVAFGED